MGIIIFWAALMVTFLVLEFATAGLTSIWFALGALGALISAAVVPDPAVLWWLQVGIFLIISGLTVAFTRPLAKRYFSKDRTATNADRVLEMIGVVRETVDNTAGHGTVYVGGKLWTARSEGTDPIPEEAQVEILRIEGVKLIVRPVKESELVETQGQEISS